MKEYGIEDMKYVIMTLGEQTEEEYEKERQEWLASTTPEEREEIRKEAIKFLGLMPTFESMAKERGLV